MAALLQEETGSPVGEMLLPDLVLPTLSLMSQVGLAGGLPGAVAAGLEAPVGPSECDGLAKLSDACHTLDEAQVVQGAMPSPRPAPVAVVNGDPETASSVPRLAATRDDPEMAPSTPLPTASSDRGEATSTSSPATNSDPEGGALCFIVVRPLRSGGGGLCSPTGFRCQESAHRCCPFTSSPRIPTSVLQAETGIHCPITTEQEVVLHGKNHQADGQNSAYTKH